MYTAFPGSANVTEHRSQLEDRTGRPPRDLDQALGELESLREQFEALQLERVWSNRLITLGTMAAVLAHEYNNLVTPIGSYAQLALQHPEDKELTRKALESAAEAVNQAKAIAEATLAFARPDEDSEEPEDSTGSIRSAIDQSLKYLGHALKRDDIAMSIHVPDVGVKMPGIRLQQVLVNLIDNARKAMSGQDRPRRLDLAGVEQDGGLLLQVADSGPGIDPAVLGSIFEAFVTRPAGCDTPPGTGLGLRICKDLIESAGGWITASSDTGEGATFRFWLPLSN